MWIGTPAGIRTQITTSEVITVLETGVLPLNYRAMEEGVGFEPTEDVISALNSFQDCLNKPNSDNPPYRGGGIIKYTTKSIWK